MGGGVGEAPAGRPEALREFLRTRRFGRELRWLERCDSTNDVALDLAAAGAPEGSVVVADGQSRGRGRGGREWHSRPGLGLYLSVILRPEGKAAAVPLQTFLAAVALTEALRRRCGAGAVIRWPNDVLIGGCKVAGILAEGRTRSGRVRELVVGVGVNLQHRPGDFPEELRDRATSLREAGSALVDPVRILAFILEGWEGWYDRFGTDGPAELLEAWNRYSPGSHGARVRVRDGGVIRTGRTRGITADGALVLEEEGGTRVPIRFGEIKTLLEVEP